MKALPRTPLLLPCFYTSGTSRIFYKSKYKVCVDNQVPCCPSSWPLILLFIVSICSHSGASRVLIVGIAFMYNVIKKKEKVRSCLCSPVPAFEFQVFDRSKGRCWGQVQSSFLPVWSTLVGETCSDPSSLDSLLTWCRQALSGRTPHNTWDSKEEQPQNKDISTSPLTLDEVLISFTPSHPSYYKCFQNLMKSCWIVPGPTYEMQEAVNKLIDIFTYNCARESSSCD